MPTRIGSTDRRETASVVLLDNKGRIVQECRSQDELTRELARAGMGFYLARREASGAWERLERMKARKDTDLPVKILYRCDAARLAAPQCKSCGNPQAKLMSAPCEALCKSCFLAYADAYIRACRAPRREHFFLNLP